MLEVLLGRWLLFISIIPVFYDNTRVVEKPDGDMRGVAARDILQIVVRIPGMEQGSRTETPIRVLENKLH